jgi:hypothetical protein
LEGRKIDGFKKVYKTENRRNGNNKNRRKNLKI